MAHPLRRLRRIAGSAACVEEPIGFAARELAGRRTTAEYTLRGTQLRAAIRHPMLDMWVLEEIFRSRAYSLPVAVRARLTGLGRPPRVVDLGGHIGLFGLFVLKNFPRARVASFEPDPGNARVLRRCIGANNLDDVWTVEEAAAATADGEASFVSDYQLSALGDDPGALAQEHESLRSIFPFLDRGDLLKPELVRVRVRDVFPALEGCDLLKIDVQGGEWELLADPRFNELDLQAIVLETHPRAATVEDPQGYVLERLAAIGLNPARVDVAHAGESVIWGVRR